MKKPFVVVFYLMLASFFYNSANAQLKIFLKLDDFYGTNNSSSSTLALDYLVSKKIKASIGFIANRSDESALNVFSTYLNATNANGDKLFEVWHHGFDHINPEFDATPYEYQKQHFEFGDQLITAYLRVQMHSFGAPFNHIDKTTNIVISENPNYKVTMFNNPAPAFATGILNLTNRVNMENGTGKPEYAYFLTNYNANKSIYKDYIVLQGHPKFWTSVQLNEFSQIIDFLIAEGCEFQLPYEYYLSLNPLTPHPTKTQAITFPALLNKNIEDPDFIPEASSSSNLPVSFNSSNATVATIVNGNIHLVGEGTTVITASQIGDETYKSADYVSKTLTVSKKSIQLDPNKLQGLNFDLKDWKLQTISPTNTSTDIGAASLVAGYSSSFFYRNASDGSIVFKVPSNGGTTNNSTYPRCELRQMGAGANWALDDPSEHYLLAECKVIQVANAKPQIIIGQIHGSETNSELIKLRWTGYEAGKCYVEARFENNDATKSEYGVKLATGLSLGDLVTYTITMKSGKITVTVNGSSASQTYTSAYFGTTDAYYFKAGNYLQYNNLTNPTLVYGQTQFYKLSLDKTLGTTNFDLSNLKYYPNPVESILTLNYANLITAIQVYNTAGQSVLKTFPNTKDFQIDMSHLTKGIYYVEVLSDEKREIIKVIKK